MIEILKIYILFYYTTRAWILSRDFRVRFCRERADFMGSCKRKKACDKNCENDQKKEEENVENVENRKGEAKCS